MIQAPEGVDAGAHRVVGRRGVGDVQCHRADLVPVPGDEVVELLRTPGGGDQPVSRIQYSLRLPRPKPRDAPMINQTLAMMRLLLHLPPHGKCRP